MDLSLLLVLFLSYTIPISALKTSAKARGLSSAKARGLSPFGSITELNYDTILKDSSIVFFGAHDEHSYDYFRSAMPQLKRAGVAQLWIEKRNTNSVVPPSDAPDLDKISRTARVFNISVVAIDFKKVIVEDMKRMVGGAASNAKAKVAIFIGEHYLRASDGVASSLMKEGYNIQRVFYRVLEDSDRVRLRLQPENTKLQMRKLGEEEKARKRADYVIYYPNISAGDGSGDGSHSSDIYRPSNNNPPSNNDRPFDPENFADRIGWMGHNPPNSRPNTDNRPNSDDIVGSTNLGQHDGPGRSHGTGQANSPGQPYSPEIVDVD